MMQASDPTQVYASSLPNNKTELWKLQNSPYGTGFVLTEGHKHILFSMLQLFIWKQIFLAL